MKINILFFIATLGQNGGAQTFLYYLIKYMDKHKFNIIVVTFKKIDNFYLQFEKIGIKVIELKFTRFLPLLSYQYKFSPIVFPQLIYIIKKYKIDILHLNLDFTTIYGTQAGKFLNKIITRTEHSTIMWTDNISRKYNYKYPYLADKIICVSAFARDFFLKEFPKLESRTILIYNGVDTNLFDHTKEYNKNGLKNFYNITNEDILFGIIGNLTVRKGHEYFINAFWRLSKAYSNVKAFIIGEGNLYKKLKKQVHDLQLTKKVIFTGNVTDMPSYIALIDYFVNSSLEENLSLAILEIMSMAKPVIVTRTQGNPEVITHLHNGYIVETKSIDELYSGMKFFIDKKDFAKKIGDNARKTVEDKFSCVRMAHEYEKLFTELYNERMMIRRT